MASVNNNSINIAYMNIRGQTGLEYPKQVQIENFLKSYKVDVLHLQESNITDETFLHCNFINSNYELIVNNASNKYGTATASLQQFPT